MKMAAKFFSHTYVNHVKSEGDNFDGFLGKLKHIGLQAAMGMEAEMAAVKLDQKH